MDSEERKCIPDREAPEYKSIDRRKEVISWEKPMLFSTTRGGELNLTITWE